MTSVLLSVLSVVWIKRKIVALKACWLLFVILIKDIRPAIYLWKWNLHMLKVSFSWSNIRSKSQGSLAIKIAHEASLWYSTLNLEFCPVCCKKNSTFLSQYDDGVTMALSLSLRKSYPIRRKTSSQTLLNEIVW